MKPNLCFLSCAPLLSCLTDTVSALNRQKWTKLKYFGLIFIFICQFIRCFSLITELKQKCAVLALEVLLTYCKPDRDMKRFTTTHKAHNLFHQFVWLCTLSGRVHWTQMEAVGSSGGTTAAVSHCSLAQITSWLTSKGWWLLWSVPFAPSNKSATFH